MRLGNLSAATAAVASLFVLLIVLTHPSLAAEKASKEKAQVVAAAAAVFKSETETLLRQLECAQNVNLGSDNPPTTSPEQLAYLLRESPAMPLELQGAVMGLEKLVQNLYSQALLFSKENGNEATPTRQEEEVAEAEEAEAEAEEIQKREEKEAGAEEKRKVETGAAKGAPAMTIDDAASEPKAFKPKVLLVVSRWDEDLSWLEGQSSFEYVVCPHGTAVDGGGRCSVPINKGAEASAYLLYIINNWDTLPDVLVFNDASERSWHQRFDMIKLLEQEVPKFDGGFTPLNSLKIDSDQPNRAWRHDKFSVVWDAVVRPHLDDMACPTRIIGDGSAQFIVSRDRIKLRSVELYKDLYAYAIGSKRWPGDETWTDARNFPFSPGGPKTGSNAWVGGVYFLEWIWHILFGEPAILDKYQK